MNDDLAAEAARQLREMMHSGELRPGMRLNQAELAGKLGISRTPVRDALIELENEGFVAPSGRRGLVVAEISIDDLIEIYEIREALDGMSARLAAQRASEEQLDALEETHVAMHERLEEFDAYGWTRLNIEFHTQLFDASGNRRMAAYRPIIYLSLQRLYTAVTWQRQSPLASWAEHRELLDALHEHDSDRSEQIARAHIADARAMVEAARNG